MSHNINYIILLILSGGDWPIEPAYAPYCLWTSLILIKMDHFDSAACYAEKYVEKMSASSREEWKDNYRYLVKELQIASAQQPEDLEKITPDPTQPMDKSIGPNIWTSLTPFFPNSLAEAYLRFGLPDKAIAEYERLMTFNPDREDLHLVNPRYRYYLGILYQEKGMKEQAVAQYRKFLDLWQDADPVFKEPDDARKRLEKLLD